MGDDRGAIIVDVREADGPAGRAGLQAGDVIVDFDGKPVMNAQDLIAKVASTPPDQTVNVIFIRDKGDKITRERVSMTLGERPTDNRRSSDNTGPTRLQLDRGKEDQKPFGLTLVELTPQLAATYNLDGQKGLVVKEIHPDSFIAEVKTTSGGPALGEGDVIQRINRVPVTDQKSFNAVVANLRKGDPVVLHVSVYSAQTGRSQLKIVQFTVQ
jgi:serine protease Do